MGNVFNNGDLHHDGVVSDLLHELRGSSSELRRDLEEPVSHRMKVHRKDIMSSSLLSLTMLSVSRNLLTENFLPRKSHLSL